MKRILCSLFVATQPFSSVLADDAPKEKKAKVSLWISRAGQKTTRCRRRETGRILPSGPALTQSMR